VHPVALLIGPTTTLTSADQASVCTAHSTAVLQSGQPLGHDQQIVEGNEGDDDEGDDDDRVIMLKIRNQQQREIKEMQEQIKDMKERHRQETARMRNMIKERRAKERRAAVEAPDQRLGEEVNLVQLLQTSLPPSSQPVA